MGQSERNKKGNDAALTVIGKVLALRANVDFVVAIGTGSVAAFLILAHSDRLLGGLLAGLAALFLVLGVVALLAEDRRFALLTRHVQRTTIADLDEIAVRHLVQAYFEALGYTVVRTDGERLEAIDLVARKGKTSNILVRTRDWDQLAITLGPVKSISNAAGAVGGAAALYVTNGRFASDAWSFAKGHAITIVDAGTLAGMVAEILGMGDKGASVSPCRGPADAPEVPRHVPHDVERFIFLDVNVMRDNNEILADTLSRFSRYKIVLTTGKDKADEVVARMPILQSRFAGVTPTVGATTGHGHRYHEIMEYLRGIPGGHRSLWISIESDPLAVPEGTAELVLVNRDRGFTQSAADRVTEVIAIGERRAAAA
jgi:hypothetical protein